MHGLMQGLMILYRKGFDAWVDAGFDDPLSERVYITITTDVYTRGYPSKREMSLIMRNESHNEK